MSTDHLLNLFMASMESVNGRTCVSDYLKDRPIHSPVALLAIGKAAPDMAQGALDALGESICDALIISKKGFFESCAEISKKWPCIESAHPVPDESSLQAGQALVDFVAKQENRKLIVLLSGGASSLVEYPEDNVSLDDMRRVNEYLVSNEYSIKQINAIRQRLSKIKGGGLKQFLKTEDVEVLLLSDVAGNDPDVIGSGLLAGRIDCGDLSDRLPVWIMRLIVNRNMSPEVCIRHKVLVSIETLLKAAKSVFEQTGLTVKILPELFSGNAEKLGALFAKEFLSADCDVLIQGGESVMQLPANVPPGGRNQHAALAAAKVLDGHANTAILFAGTDGNDGTTVYAGAIVDGETIRRGIAKGFNVEECLRKADATSFLQASGGLINRIHTGTNVMDIVIGMKNRCPQ